MSHRAALLRPDIAPGMIVGLLDGTVGLLKARYVWRPQLVPQATQARAIITIGRVQRDVREDEIAGRLRYERAPLQIVTGGRQ